MDKKRTELIPLLLMFSLRICSGIMDSVCSAAEICFMESVKTVKTNPISCDLFQMIWRITHLIDTGTVKRQAIAPDSMIATS